MRPAMHQADAVTGLKEAGAEAAGVAGAAGGAGAGGVEEQGQTASVSCYTPS